MTRSLAIRSIFKLGVGVLMLILVTACDDAPETPSPKKLSETREELTRKQLLEKAREPTILTVQNFEIREDGKTVTLPDADKDRIVALGAGLCDVDNVAGEADKDKIQQALRVKSEKLVSALLEMGYTNVSIKITRGQDGRNLRQEIRFSWKDENQQTSCQTGTF
jgi:hypothetical protein